MTEDEFKTAFEKLEIIKLNTNWKYSYYQKIDDDGRKETYSFKIDKADRIYLMLNFYNPLNYAQGCEQQNAQNYAEFRIFKKGERTPIFKNFKKKIASKSYKYSTALDVEPGEYIVKV